MDGQQARSLIDAIESNTRMVKAQTQAYRDGKYLELMIGHGGLLVWSGKTGKVWHTEGGDKIIDKVEAFLKGEKVEPI